MFENMRRVPKQLLRHGRRSMADNYQMLMVRIAVWQHTTTPKQLKYFAMDTKPPP